MTAVTLAQAAQYEKQPLKKGLLWGLVTRSNVADILTFRNIDGLSETGVRQDEVITPDWVALGGAIASKTANGKPLAYSIYEMALHIDVPQMIEDQASDMLIRQSVRQTQSAIKGAAYVINDTFINGDQGTDANQFDGLNKIVAGMDSSQTFGSTEIDISATATSAANLLAVERLLDAHTFVEGQRPDAAFCNDNFSRQFRKIILREKLLGDTHDWINDTFDVLDPRRTERTASQKPAFIFDNVPYYTLGPKADQTTQIIGDTYTEGGSTAHGTRIFLVKLGPEDVEGIQGGAMQTVNVGPLEGSTNKRTRLVWHPGLAVWGPRSVLKVQGIRAA